MWMTELVCNSQDYISFYIATYLYFSTCRSQFHSILLDATFVNNYELSSEVFILNFLATIVGNQSNRNILRICIKCFCPICPIFIVCIKRIDCTLIRADGFNNIGKCSYLTILILSNLSFASTDFQR